VKLVVGRRQLPLEARNESIFMGTEAPNTEKEETLGTRSEVEVMGGCRRRVKASIPVEKVREELDKNYRQLTQSVQLPGFRRGHVPRRLLEARYGEEIEADVKEALLTVSLGEVVEEKDLKVIGSPRFENVSFSKDADLSYEVDLEVRPEFEVDGYKGLEVEREALPMKEEYVDLALENLQARHSKLTAVEPAESSPDDYFRGTYRLHRDGVLVKTSEEVTFVPSRKQIDAFAVPDLPERWAAWKSSPETSLSLDVKVPADFPDEVLRGADAKLEFHVEESLRRELHPMDDAFAKERGAESLDALKGMIREQLADKLQRDEESLVDQKIMAKLLETTSMDLPDGLIESQRERSRLETEYKLLEEGLPADEVEKRLEEQGAGVEDLRRALKTFFILEKIAEKEKIFAMEREIDGRVHAMAAHYHAPEDRLREELRKTGRLEELRTVLRHEKVRKFLREDAKVLQKEDVLNKEDSAPPPSASGSPPDPADSSPDPGPKDPGPGDRRESSEGV
jgi:trigger factor